MTIPWRRAAGVAVLAMAIALTGCAKRKKQPAATASAEAASPTSATEPAGYMQATLTPGVGMGDLRFGATLEEAIAKLGPMTPAWYNMYSGFEVGGPRPAIQMLFEFKQAGVTAGFGGEFGDPQLNDNDVAVRLEALNRHVKDLKLRALDVTAPHEITLNGASSFSPMHAGKTDRGVALLDSRSRVEEVYGKPTWLRARASQGRTLAVYPEGIAFFYNATGVERLERIIVGMGYSDAQVELMRLRMQGAAGLTSPRRTARVAPTAVTVAPPSGFVCAASAATR